MNFPWLICLIAALYISSEWGPTFVTFELDSLNCCLEPIFTTGTPRKAPSLKPEDEFPIRQLQLLIKTKLKN